MTVVERLLASRSDQGFDPARVTDEKVLAVVAAVVDAARTDAADLAGGGHE